MTTALISLDDLNGFTPEAFKSALARIFENAPWVAANSLAERPFTSLTALHKAMIAQLSALPETDLIRFFQGHARLSPETLRRGTTPESQVEQASAGLDSLDPAIDARLERLNIEYEARFGFPFILAIRNASLATLMATFERRLMASVQAEQAEALLEISAISWMRLLDLVKPAPTGSLSMHVLDTVRAAPAAGLGVELWRRNGTGGKTRVSAFTTNADGACDHCLLAAGALTAGTYEWWYDAPTYFAAQGYATPARAFLGKVSVSFTVWNPEEHFHVPLLLTPGSYMTYRGS